MDPDTLKKDILDTLKTVKYPGFSQNILRFNLLKKLELVDKEIVVELVVTSENPDIAATLEKDISAALKPFTQERRLSLKVAHHFPEKSKVKPMSGQALPGVKRVIAVASGKGGVGKSTFSTHLACALSQLLGKEAGHLGVGLMDCDIYGPSIPLMMGIQDRPGLADNKIVPLQNYGIKLMSMGFLIDEGTPVIWRGPMVMKAIQQFTQSVDWGELDVLIVDLPPGTGDAQLSLVQTLRVDGAVVITTPQPAAVEVAVRGAALFDKVNVPLWGIVENMSYLESSSGEKQFLFGKDGGKVAASRLGVPFLGQIPLDEAIRQGCDYGIPVLIDQPDRPSAQAFRSIAGRIVQLWMHAGPAAASQSLALGS